MSIQDSREQKPVTGNFCHWAPRGEKFTLCRNEYWKKNRPAAEGCKTSTTITTKSHQQKITFVCFVSLNANS